MVNWENCELCVSCALQLFFFIKLVTKQMMKNQQFANAECPDKNMLREFTPADTIKKLAAEVDDEGQEDAGLYGPPLSRKKSPILST